MADTLHGLDWSLIQAFLAVAEEGSLSAAARKLGASQPTLGRQIRALEESLGAELFQRRPTGLVPTETGAAMLAPARRIRDAVAEIALSAAGQETGLDGAVRITASEALSYFHLARIVGQIRTELPGVAIDLVASDDSSNLLWREADIAVRMYRPTQLDLVTRHIGEIELAAFATKAYLDRRGRPRSLEDALTHDWVGYDRNTQIVDGFVAAGLPVTREFFRSRTDHNIVAWALVRSGCGIGFGQAIPGRADPLLEEVALGFPLPTLPVWLTAHETVRRVPRVARVWDALAEGLRSVCL